MRGFTKPFFRRSSLLTIAIILILGCGFWSAHWNAKLTAEEMRKGLLQQTTEISLTIDPELVKQLNFTQSDKQNPAFTRIRRQLVAYRRMIPDCNIYSMALRNDSIIFGPESFMEPEPSSDSETSYRSGMIYEQPSKDHFKAFKITNPIVIGPYSDEFGTFISGLAPVLDPVTHDVIMVIGMDIMHDQWQSKLTEAKAPSLIAAFTLTLIMLVSYALITNRNRFSAWWRHKLSHIETGVVATVCIVFTIFATCMAASADRNNIESHFYKFSDARATAIRDSFKSVSTNVDALGRLYECSNEISSAEFNRFTKPLLNTSSIQAYQWVPVVGLKKKIDIEAQAQSQGLSGFPIWEIDGGGNQVPSKEKDIYYPVYFISSSQTNEQMVGFDLGSRPICKIAMEKAANDGMKTATDPIEFTQGTKKQKSMLIFRPVFSRLDASLAQASGETPKNNTIIGFVAASLKIQSLMDNNIRENAEQMSVIDTDILDVMSEPPVFVAHCAGQLSKKNATFTKQQNQLYRIYPLFAFDRTFAIISYPNEQFYAQNHPVIAYIAGFSGLFISIILTSFARSLRNRQNILEDLVAKRTDQLSIANSALVKTTQKAEQMAFEAQAANLAKGQFLANMSHEIRTPMNGVIGMTALLMETNLTEEQHRYAEVVRSSGTAMLSLINDILDFSKIEADKLELENVDFDLREVLEETAEMLAFRAQEKGIELVCRVDPNLQTNLTGDPGRLRQILINLGGNAVKFTSDGEVIINSSIESQTDDYVKIRFEVQDTGIGIPQDKMHLLFHPFQQIDYSHTRKFSGTGLGLAISKRLVELFKGQIGVESSYTQGSKFWFTAEIKKQKISKTGNEDFHSVKDMRILIVDDNSTNCKVLSEQLQMWNARSKICSNAGDAIEMLITAKSTGDPFHIAIIDMQMPYMDGQSLGKFIRSNPEIKDTIVIIMGSPCKPEDTIKNRKLGFSGSLSKPIKRFCLKECIANALGHHPQSMSRPSNISLGSDHNISAERLNSIRILLAEDNPINQKVAMGMLKKLGLHTDAVTNGQEAIDAIKIKHYDLIFMDVQMPVMDGLTATREIRCGGNNIPNPDIPIIAMTANAIKGDREQCIDAGMNDYIPKPVMPQKLTEVLREWL